MSFDVDHHEPPIIISMLDLAIPDLEVKGLNQEGWADYRYDAAECFCHGSTIYNTERKTWDDLVGGIEEIEVQLGNQLDKHPGVHSRLIIEGVAEPAFKGINIYRMAQGKNVMSGTLKGSQQQTFKHIVSWVHQVAKYWEVVYTNSYASTASVLAAYYSADQTPEEGHKTFHRMFKERHWQMDPQAEKILGAAPKGFGEQRALAVAKHFGTAWRAFKAEPEEWMQIDGIGEVLARGYLRGLGRPDA